ncbi:hypothetical protein POTOM_058095 [Populus tomentosa]|uniref:Uncharacterized protein n=1 Tax=Populus tomentosa TaxID=118781 RepID=A0A8X7Y3I0_POPTO|nr:hypothetical protein POTOM_058095 [Populus tomentosa]
MSGIMHKIEETLHIGGKKEEQKSGKPDEHKGEHKGESHGEHKPENSGHKEGFLEKIHGDGHAVTATAIKNLPLFLNMRICGMPCFLNYVKAASWGKRCRDPVYQCYHKKNKKACPFQYSME